MTECREMTSGLYSDPDLSYLSACFGKEMSPRDTFEQEAAG